MRPVQSFRVQPALPERLRALEDLAYNLRWSWDHETIALFRRLDRELWESTYHNPVQMLGGVSQHRLEEASRDEAFLAHLDRAESALRHYVSAASTWYRRSFDSSYRPLVAYFSMEFGLTECLKIYSGGLGILAGDHLKSASDLGLPLVGVGLLYQKGYFRQYLNPEGWQQEHYPVNDFHNLPVKPFLDEAGKPILISLELDGLNVAVQLWQAQVGRVTLVLLDTNVNENPQEIQDITDELYGGDLDMRIRQELVLGIGGIKALERLGLQAWVYHMNEGHCAFLALERIRNLMEQHGLSFKEAGEVVSASTVFTTHTPVPAGIDIFPPDLVAGYMRKYRDRLGLQREEFLDLGRVRPGRPEEPFNMAVLAIRNSCYINGVSRLHGNVARKMWQDLWPGVPLDESPIVHVTNGIHPGSWISDDMRYLYDRYLSPGWSEQPSDSGVWRRGEHIPGEELWRTHERRRERLVAFTRRRLSWQLMRRGAGKAEVAEAENVLDPEALTIGFARRFATYKRGTLLLSDPDRLLRILSNPEKPVQIIFAGKAHPKDDNGKTLIREIVQTTHRPEFRRHIVFLEDYDAVISRYLVQGVDVWLNTPRRPMEASGTSGMKAAFNGALNLSIPDGWWDEAYSTRTGWAIGRGEDYVDHAYQDRVEAGTLYDLLEREVVPLFYKRTRDDLPREWIDLMKSAMSDLCSVFNTNRMVQQYTMEGYQPALDRRIRLEAEDFRGARDLAEWRIAVQEVWSDVDIKDVRVALPEKVTVGKNFSIQADVVPAALGPDDLMVQAYIGRIDENQQLEDGEAVPMEFVEQNGDGSLLFQASLECSRSGMQGVTVRLIPNHAELIHPQCATRIIWAE